MTDLDKQHDEIFRKAQAVQNQNTENTDEGIHATAHAPQALALNLDKGVGKQLIAALWLSAAIAGAALIGLIATCFFIYATIGHVAVLQYDLFDLRSKMGQAHENTPPPENSD